MTIEISEVGVMELGGGVIHVWSLMGFVRPIPDVASFVVPVISRSDAADDLFLCVLDESRNPALVRCPSEAIVTRIRQTVLCEGLSPESILPLYGYEDKDGSIYFGSPVALLRHYCSPRTRLEGPSLKVMQRLLGAIHNPNFSYGQEKLLIRAKPLEPFGELQLGTRIKVIGVGDSGSNIVQHMAESNPSGVEFICSNTDSQALSRVAVPNKIQLGQRGLGTSGKPEKGREAAELVVDDLRSAIKGAHMLFITAGMGGGTGTGAAPVIARVAKEMGVLTVGVVTKPFEWEGVRRMTTADEGVAELEANVDSMIVVLNEKLMGVLGNDIPSDEAFAYTSEVLRNAVRGIAEIINVPNHVNVDFDDVRTVMGEPGKALIGTAVANGPDRARIAAGRALACPFLEGIDLSGAKGVLVLITAATGSLKLSESKLAMNTVRAYASPDAHVIYGTAYDDNLGDEVRVTVVATGLSRHGQRRTAPPLQVLRTGTDNALFNVPTLSPFTGETPHAPASQPDYGGMAVPNVWRTNRTQSAAKVDGLSSGGMDDFEIPAFLRKRAD